MQFCLVICAVVCFLFVTLASVAAPPFLSTSLHLYNRDEPPFLTTGQGGEMQIPAIRTLMFLRFDSTICVRNIEANIISALRISYSRYVLQLGIIQLSIQ